MPLFSFVCRECNIESELLQRAHEKLVCPSCGSTDIERLLSKFATISAQPAAEPMSCGTGHCCRMQGGCSH